LSYDVLKEKSPSEQLQALAREIFPQTAHDCLPEWETLLGLVTSAGATISERQAACQARSRGSMGCALPELRASLYPLLRPSTAFAEDFGGTLANSRLDWAGNGTRIISAGAMSLTISNPVDGDWLAGNSNRGTMRVNDVTDGWTWRALITAASLGTDTASGIVALADDDNAVMFGPGDAGTVETLRVDTVVEGVLTVGVASVALPGWPFYVQMTRDRATGQITFSYGADADALTDLVTIARPVPVLRRVGFYARNITASASTISGTFSELQLVHETPLNNVEIVEQRETNCDGAGDATLIFEAHVIRRPTDPGTYDIKQAQRLCDSVKLGHTLVLVGETDAFKCDDPYSLCDRDLLGD
jgi:hypothetical protein